MSQIKRLAEVPSNEARRGFERAQAASYFFITSQDTDENPRVPEVRTDFDIGHGYKSNPRVIQLAQDDLAHFFSYLFPEPFGSPPRHKSYPEKCRTLNDTRRPAFLQGN